MIVVFSSEGDRSTDEVLRWVRYFGRDDVIRINSEDRFKKPVASLMITEKSASFNYGNVHISSSVLSAVWFRKGRNWLTFAPNIFPVLGENQAFCKYISDKIEVEASTILAHLYMRLEGAPRCLGRHQAYQVNKLDALLIAQRFGLQIPEFWIANDSEAISNIIKSRKCITKASSDGVYFVDHSIGRGYFSYTETATENSISLPTTSVPSFFQRRVEKASDIRAFFVEERFVAAEILSQLNEQTQTDFRRYDEIRPNRILPHILPSDIQFKLANIMKELNLNTGSVDLILDSEGNYIFLEVNPVGQFGSLSAACNWCAERTIAEFLVGE